MNPLSFWTYIIRNTGKIIPVIVIIALSLVAILVTKVLAESVRADFENFGYFSKNYYTVTIEQTKLNSEILAEVEGDLKSTDNIEDLVRGNSQRIGIQSLFGSFPYQFSFIDSSRVEEFMTNLGWQITDGRLPEVGKNEVVLTREALKNKNLKVGDKVGDSLNSSEFLKGEYVIVGLIDGSEMSPSGGFGLLDLKSDEEKVFSSFFLKPKLGGEAALTDSLKSLKENYGGILRISTYESETEYTNQQLRPLNQIIWVLNLLVAGIMTTSIILLVYIFLSGRLKEFAILDALGYGRFYITGKVLFEFTIVTILAWILGFVLTEGLNLVANRLIFIPRAMAPLTVLNMEVFLFSVPMIFIILIALSILIVLRLSKMDPITVIETRF